MEMFFIVNQIWMDANGNVGTRDYVYVEEAGLAPAVNRALNKYHEILGHGAISDDQYHASLLMRSDGATIKPFEYYDRRPVPEPEPEEEEEEPAEPVEQPEEP